MKLPDLLLCNPADHVTPGLPGNAVQSISLPSNQVLHCLTFNLTIKNVFQIVLVFFIINQGWWRLRSPSQRTLMIRFQQSNQEHVMLLFFVPFQVQLERTQTNPSNNGPWPLHLVIQLLRWPYCFDVSGVSRYITP